MLKSPILFSFLLTLIILSCGQTKTDQNSVDINDNKSDKINNVLTPEEINEGWTLLFDGKTLNQWRNFKKETIGSSWIIDDDAIHLQTTQQDDGSWKASDGGDIVTKNEYEDFDLRLEWKIQDCGNSGVMFYVVEDDQYGTPWQTGPEMQVLDNSCHPDAKYPTHKAGDLYDMIECDTLTVKPAGEWNQSGIKSKDGHLIFSLNGVSVLEFDMFNESWDEMVAKSKFKDMPGFGKYKKGRISLQDHDDKVWFRNIKILEL